MIKNYKHPLNCAKEEIRELKRLLKEAEIRLDEEYEKVGGRTWREVWVEWYEWFYSNAE
tara:strand:+ start:1930 stop:2106 length:177 start_codon:yes stop_codon:yes gene_type:complete